MELSISNGGVKEKKDLHFNQKDDYLNNIIDSLPGGVYVYNLQIEKVVYLNKEIYNILGFQECQFNIISKDFFLKIHPAEIEMVKSKIDHLILLNDGKHVDLEYRLKVASGEWKWIRSKIRILKRASDGKAVELLGFVEDINEIAKKLQERNNFIQRIIDLNPCIATVYNPKTGQFLFVNNAIKEMLGYDPEMFIAGGVSQISSLIHPDDLLRIQKENRLAIGKINSQYLSFYDATVHNFEYRVKTQTGEYKWLQTQGIIFNRDKEGDIDQILNISIDITERKEAEEKIRKAKEELKKVNSALECKVQERTKELNEAQKISKIGNWIYYINDQKLSWSEELFRIHNIDPALGTPDFETLLAFYPDSEKLLNKIEKAISQGIPFHYDTPLILSKGEKKSIQIIAKPELDKEGKVVRLFGTTLDITERKVFEEKILESQQQLSLVTDAIPALISYIDRDFNYTFVNEGYVKWFGLEKSEIIGKSVRELLGEEYLQKITPSLKKVFEGEATGVEIIFPNPRGEVHFFNVKYIPDFDESKRVRGCIILAINNTESISVQKALKESEERYRFMAESIPSIVWTAYADGEIDFLNSRWKEFTGLSFEDAIRFGWKNYLCPQDMGQTFDLYLSAIKKGTEFKIEHLLRRHDGEYRWMVTRAVPLKNLEGIIVRWFGTTIEIHDEKKYIENLAKTKEQLSLINLELSKKNEELQIINSDLDNFIYTASHDLKAPISNLEGLFGTLLDDVKLDDGMQEIHRMINHSFQRFRNTIKDLTEISKVQKNQNEDIGTVQFSQLLEEARYELHDQVSKTNALIEGDIQVDEIKFSRKNLRSILYNFVSNGIKYSSPARTPNIKVSTTYVDNDYILLTVKDNGLGIPEHQKKKVFGMFKRLHDHVEGTGIGLYIVKRIIDNAGGKIELESEEGIGSTFKVYLRRV